MKHATLLLASIAMATTATAQSDDAAPVHIHVQLASYRITPAELNLERGHRYILDFENASGSSHDFTARDFFASSLPSDQPQVRRGEIELKGHQSASVMVVPTKTGKFEFHCGHPMHAMFGMKGVIHVD